MEHESHSALPDRDDEPPLRLVLSEDRTALTVAWPGSPPRRLSACLLRTYSRASGAIRARLEGREVASDDGLRILAIELVGSYAVNLAFSDGHDRGIYPWAYLRDIAAAEASDEGNELLTPSSGVGHPDGDGQDALPSERSHANG